MPEKENKTKKRKEEIVDFCFAIMRFWFKYPDKSLAWVLSNLTIEENGE